MVCIREFKTMPGHIKRFGSCQGIVSDHRGPAHLSIGQEADAVGRSSHLRPDDFIFGIHRSRGEILARSVSAIAKLFQDDLTGMGDVRSRATASDKVQPQRVLPMDQLHLRCAQVNRTIRILELSESANCLFPAVHAQRPRPPER